MRNRRRPTLPGRIRPSTIGATGLNFCVRNGNRCDPSAIATETFTPNPFGSATGQTVSTQRRACEISDVYSIVNHNRFSRICHTRLFRIRWLDLSRIQTVILSEDSIASTNTQLGVVNEEKPSPRPISTGQLNTLLCVHFRPINVVVFHGPYPVNPVGNLILERASHLDAFSGYPFRR